MTEVRTWEPDKVYCPLFFGGHLNSFHLNFQLDFQYLPLCSTVLCGMYKILLFLVIFAFITTVDATEINVISKFRYLLEITALKNKLKFYLHTVAVHNPYLYVY